MSSDPPARRQYLLNLIWSWLGAATLILAGLIVAPYVIRRLGSAQYGIWALTLSLVEYCWLIDLGFRPATVKFSAEFRVLNQTAELNQLLNTALCYSSIAGSLVLLLVWPNAERIAAFFKITDPGLPILIRIVGLSWAFGLVFNVFAAALEGFQRFDLSNRIWIVSALLRSVAILAVIWRGYGLREMGFALLVTQGVTYWMIYFYCIRVCPNMSLSPRFISARMLRQIASYGRQVFPGILGTRLLQASVPALIAYFLPVQFVTYYTLTQKILDYAGEGIGRVGLVTCPRASAWMAQGRVGQVIRLSQYGNRYCLSLWLVPASFLAVFGGNICKLWVNAEFGRQAAVLLPILLVGYTLWFGQFISASILMGIGRYGFFSVSLLAESLLTIVGFVVVLPRYQLTGAAVVFSALLSLNRCLNLSRIFCREFRLPSVSFLRTIYLRPLLLAALSALLLHLSKAFLIPGDRWGELAALWLAHSLLFSAAIFFLVLEKEHRALVLNKAGTWKQYFRGHRQ